MAALPYMQLYVADYLADTMHLSTEEHGAYLLIIFNYWQTGKPIPKPRLPKIARLSNDRWVSAETSLSEFFNEVDDEWVHERIEIDLEVVRTAQTQRVAAGKASAEARKQAAKTGIAKARNDRSTTAGNPLNENATNIEEKREEENNPKALVTGTPETDEFELSSSEEESVPHGRKKLPFTYTDIQNAYNKICRGTFKGCDAMTAKRKGKIRAMVAMEFMGQKPFRDLGIGFWEQYFTDCLSNPHWCGSNDRGWRASFEFVTTPDNALKILEVE